MLAAILPRDCCAAHLAQSSHSVSDAGPATAAGHAGHAGHGQPSPGVDMADHGHHDANRGDSPFSNDEGGCAMRGLCDGPFAMLASLLQEPAVTPAISGIAPDSASGPTALRAPADPIATTSPPEIPPPRI